MTELPILERVRRRLVAGTAEPTPHTVAAALRAEHHVAGSGTVLALVDQLRSETRGAGLLDPVLATQGVTDVLVNGPDEVYLDRGRGLEKSTVRFADEESVRRLAQRLAAQAGRRLDESKPAKRIYNRSMEKPGIADGDAPLPAAVYCRISRDRERTGLGVERQEADCRALAKRLGWDVRALYVDNDISAYSGKPRPQYRAMLDAVKAGQVRAVLAWHPDRLYRRGADLEEIVTIAEKHHLQIATATSGDVDLSTPTGRMTARIVASVAQAEVERTRERASRAKAQALADGRRRGGPRPFGFDWEDKTLVIREDEAQVVREATEAVIAGRSLAAVARDLNEQGVLTSTGKRWNYQRLRDVLVRPTNAGLSATGRADRGKVEIVGEGKWPAIVDRETWETVYKLLVDPSRMGRNSNKSVWLGSGLYYCGIEGCAGVLRPAPFGQKRNDGRRRNHLYRCTAKGHLTISAAKTDNYVRRFVAEYISVPEVAAALRPDDASLAVDRKRRTVLLESRDQTEADYIADVIAGRVYAAKIQKINDELAEIEDRLTNGVQQTAAESVLNATNPAAAFMAAPVDVQRGIVRAVGLTITIKSANYRGTQWNSERIVIAPAEVETAA